MAGLNRFPFLATAAALLVACGANDPAPPRGSPAAGTGGDSGAGGAQGAYPSGPYGVTNGSVIADISWEGWRNPVEAAFDPSAFETIALSDYYDPDGTKGYRAIVVNASARWCSICKMEQKHIREERDIWGPKGVVFLGTIFEDAATKPAQPSDLVAWANTYQVDWVLVLDPTNKLSLFFDRAASPMNMIIDARTMKIRDVITGLPEESWWKNHLAPLTQ
jgi:hypothetical protein